MNGNTIDNLPITLTVVEVAKILRVGRNTAYRLVQNGAIPCVRFGRKIVIPRDALSEFLTQAQFSITSTVEKENKA